MTILMAGIPRRGTSKPNSGHTGRTVPVRFFFDFIPDWRKRSDLIRMVPLSRHDIVTKYPEIARKLGLLFDESTAAPLSPKSNIISLVQAHITDPREKECFLDELDGEVERIWNTSTIAEFRGGNLLFELPEAALRLDCTKFCKAYRRYDNFDLLLGEWIEYNMPRANKEAKEEKFISLFMKWCPKRSNLRKLVPAEKLVSTRHPEKQSVAETLGLKGPFIKVIAFLFALLGLGFVAPLLYARYVPEQPAVDPILEIFKRKSDNDLKKIFSFSSDPKEVIQALKVWISRAEETEIENKNMVDAYPPGSRQEDVENYNPVLLHISHPYVAGLIEMMDNESKEAVKGIKWVFFTPNAIGGKGKSAFEIARGLSYRDPDLANVIAVSSMDLEANKLTRWRMAATLAHEATHPQNEYLPTLRNELLAFKAAERTLVNIQNKLNEDLKKIKKNFRRALNQRKKARTRALREKMAAKKAEIEEIGQELAVERERIRVGEYLNSNIFGGDFLSVYPFNNIQPAHLLRAKIPIETLKKYLNVNTGHPKLDQQLQKAARSAIATLKFRSRS